MVAGLFDSTAPVRAEDLTDEPSAGPDYPRCRRQDDGRYSTLYVGHQRPALFGDELGAVCVVELVCSDGERLCIFPIDGDAKHMRVASLPAMPPITRSDP